MRNKAATFLFLCVSLGLGLVLVSLSANATTLTVAVDGNDANPGTPEKPLASVKKAIELVDQAGDAGEIVVRGGRYFQDISIKKPVNDQRAPALTIRAAEGETPIFDGSQILSDAQPLPGAPGVYTFTGYFAPYTAPQAWDEKQRVRYLNAADVAAVRAFPGSITLLDKTTAAFQTSDSKPPGEHVRRSVLRYGLTSERDNLTIRGLHFENFITEAKSAGVQIRDGRNVLIEDCLVRNSSTGFLAYLAYAKSPSVTFRRCKAVDVGGGVYINGENVTVENGTFIKTRDSFEVDTHDQNDTGIQCYFPVKSATIRRNLVKGFQNGIFIKTEPGHFIVEDNTVIGGAESALGLFLINWQPNNIWRRNVVVDFVSPMEITGDLEKGGIVEENVVWSERFKENNQKRLELLRKAGMNEKNVLADPRFADPENSDYRLLHDSPALKWSAEDPAGAFGAAPQGYSNPNPPALRVQLQLPAVRSGAYGKLFSERDAWIGGGEAFLRELAEDDTSTYLTPSRALKLNLNARHSTAPIVRTKIQIDDTAPAESTFAPVVMAQLPDQDGPHRVSIAVQNKDGTWSQPQIINVVLARSAPRLLSTPRVVTSERGALVTFQTDSPVIAHAELVVGDETISVPSPNQTIHRTYDSNLGVQEVEKWNIPKLNHAVALALPLIEPGQTYGYRISLSDAVGNKTPPHEGRFTAHGPSRVLHVATGGTPNGEGTLEKPLDSIQEALNRALPGDTVRMAPGLYSEQIFIGRGGVKGAPITLEAEKPNTVILDGRKEFKDVINLEKAPHVTIRNLNVRWFKNSGIWLQESPHVRIEYCRFFNDTWRRDRVDGTGIIARESSSGIFDHNILARIETGIYLLQSPGATVTHNSATALMYSALRIYDSARDTVVKNNAFSFVGNDAISLTEKDEEAFSSMILDYNNYGSNLRDVATPLPLPFPYVFANSKAVIRAKVGQGGGRYTSLTDWQKFSGQDAHSIFADPQWIDPASGQWGLKPTSPNIGTGENGATIGAIGHGE